jgi:hypothetical protein
MSSVTPLDEARNERMAMEESWGALSGAIDFAIERVRADPDHLNEREIADGHQYVIRALTAVFDATLMLFDPERPSFLPMLESVRYIGAAGPDIDYDVAIVTPGIAHRITGARGDASYVGITVYGHAGDAGASAILDSVDVDDLVASDGSFEFAFEHPEAARVIIRQYFHDRTTQARGHWSIERVAETSQHGEARHLPTEVELAYRLANATQSLRWSAQLNQMWSPERRATPNEFIRQSADDVVAAIPNPDVSYAFSWWRLGAGEALVIDLVPPSTRYWALQICDRWFQCFPDRRPNLNDRQVAREPDGSVRFVLAERDPGMSNWVETSGHELGVMFFRWLHADPEVLPTCRVVSIDETHEP